MFTVCPKSLYPFYIVTYYIKEAKTSWTYSIFIFYSEECKERSLFVLHKYSLISQCLIVIFLQSGVLYQKYCVSMNSCPIFRVHSLYEIGQDYLDIPYEYSVFKFKKISFLAVFLHRFDIILLLRFTFQISRLTGKWIWRVWCRWTGCTEPALSR